MVCRTSENISMSQAVEAIRSHLLSKLPTDEIFRSEGITIAALLKERQDAHKQPICVPPDLYEALINALRMDLMGIKGATAEVIEQLPTIRAWLDQGMGLAHSFALGDEMPHVLAGHGHKANQKYGDSLLEEMWHYIDHPVRSFPEQTVRGILSDEGLIIELSGIATVGDKLSLNRCFARSCPSILSGCNWSHWERHETGHEKRKANLHLGRTLQWLPALSFDVLGLDAFCHSENYARNHISSAITFDTCLLLARSIKHTEDLEIFDAYVEKVLGGWSNYRLNKALSTAIDTNFFWSFRSRQGEKETIEDFWVARAQKSLEGDKFYATWVVNLAAAIYASQLPQPQPSTLMDREAHLARALGRQPGLIQVFEYFNENAGWLISCAEDDEENQIWADEIFLSPLGDEARNIWLESLSVKVSDHLKRQYRKNQGNYHGFSQINWFFEARHPTFATLVCDKLVHRLSLARMTRDYPTAGTSLVEMAFYDLRRPERQQEAISHINSTRSEKWKLFLLGYLNVSPQDVKLTPRQLDRVFSRDIGL